MNAIKNKYTGTYFSWVITIVTAIIVSFALFIILIIGILSRESIEKQMKENFAVVSKGLQKDIESIDNSLKSFCEYIYINDTVAGNIFKGDTEQTEIYADLRAVYASAVSFNSNIDSMQFYNAYNGVLYSIGSNMDTNENQLADILSEADSITANTMLLRKMKYFADLKEHEKTVFSYFVYETSRISENSSFLSINLKNEWLMDGLNTYSSIYNDNKFVIFSSDSDFFLYSSQDLRGNKKEIIEAAVNNGKYVDINGEKHILYSAGIESNNLMICSLIPHSKVYDAMNGFTIMLLGLSLLIVILGIILSFFVARKIYMPFGKLYGEIAKNETNKNELENIKMIFHKHSEMLLSYEKQIRDESETVRNYNIRRLLNSSEELSESEIEKIFSCLSISMEQCFIVAVLCIDSIEGKSIYNDSLINYAFYNIAMEVIRGRYKAEGEQMLGNGIAVIISVPNSKDTNAELYKIMQEIKEHMAYNFNAIISASLSSPVKMVEEISAAAVSAKQNLIYRFNYGYGQFFTEEFISANKQNPKQAFSADFEKLLTESTEESGAIAIIEKIIDEIRSMSYLNAFMESVRLSKILREQLKLDVELTTGDYNNNFAINQTLPVFYREVCEKLSEKFINIEKKTEYDIETLRIVGGAKTYIEENFSDSEANIVELAEELGVSQRRLSEAFRKETGMSFAAYMTKFRINKAKEYILDSKFDIKKISAMVGISNSTYFYKLFKNECGVTPTQYKKIHSSAKNK